VRVAVVGAGIVGVTTAYELGADGHEVAVFDRRAGVAAEASYANAGVVAPGYVTPWASPGMPWKVARGLLARHSAVRFGPGTVAALPWMWRFLRACRMPVYQANRARLQRLAHYSGERMEALASTLRLRYEQTRGYTVLLRSPQDLKLAQPGIAVLRELGVEFEVIDAARCRTLEPRLAEHTPLHAAIHLPRDGVGNCRQFAQLLRAHACARGVRFELEREVRAIVPGPTVELMIAPAGAEGPAGRARFDAVVVCAGHASPRLLGPLGLRIPILPIYGCSLTAPLRRFEGLGDLGPRSGLMDERFKVAITRIGKRIRVAGSAEVGGAADRLHRGALKTLYKVLDDWFPAAADLSQALHWKGARPMLPDGPPLLGASGVPGVWLNVGHGSSGWALACGSARVVADQLTQRAPVIDVAGLGVDRLG
jgi:D-amino-acid dehydrogenase